MKVISRSVIATLLTFAVAAAAVAAPAKQASKKSGRPSLPSIDIPYHKFVLDNGLTLIVHEDRKAPIVAVNVWYHVGSKNEKEGKTGFAHLFEHLMFNGSENYNKDYFEALEAAGATDLNGTTNEDRTNYFQNVPTSALDMVLWLESDRMGHSLGVIDQGRLDEQRGVVQNEKRQYENQPYSISDELLTTALFPPGHPYHHTVIGSMEDLTAASLDDVKQWFNTYYGAANAVLVIAGDIDPQTALARTRQYFGHIPAGPPIARFESWVPDRKEPARLVAHDRVPQARLYKAWAVPGRGTADAAYLNLLSDVLVSDKTSRLYKRLVYDEQIATDVSAFIYPMEIAGAFVIEATARPGDDLRKVEKAVDEELARLLEAGPTQEELDRVRTGYFAGFVRGIERIGGFGGKSDILAASEIYGDSPDAYKQTLEYTRNATVSDLRSAGRKWLDPGVVTLEILPFPEYKPAPPVADRKTMPSPGKPPAPKFPEVRRATLSNGMKLIVAERHDVPVVNFSLQVDAGYAADQLALPGTAALAMNMLDEGTETRDALEISRDLAALGATITSGSNLDMSLVNLSTLKTTLDPALALYADVILNPSFPQTDFSRLQKLQLAGIQREKVQPVQMALRVLPRLLYGPQHAYGNPLTGSGTEESVRRITRADLIKFHSTWFKPNNATMIVVGDTTLADIQPRLEKLFARWKRGDIPKKNLSTVAIQEKPVVYIVDKPGAIQSTIFAGVIAPPKANPDEIAIETMNTVLGGNFISRLNLNLREDKHWSYGAGSFLQGARGQRPFIAYAPVQTDKTKESLAEIVRELRDIVKDRVVTAEELAFAQSSLTLALPGSWETGSEVLGAISQIVRYDLPEDYFATYAGSVNAVTLSTVNVAAQKVVRPENMTWVVVGDRAKIESGIRELNLGEIRYLDADGNPVR